MAEKDIYHDLHLLLFVSWVSSHNAVSFFRRTFYKSVYIIKAKEAIIMGILQRQKNKSLINKGYAVLIVVGSVAVLTLVLVITVYLSRSELRLAENNVRQVQVRYLAEAGINYSIAELIYGSHGALNNSYDGSSESWAGYGTINISITPSKTGSFSRYIRDCARQIYVNDTNDNSRLESMINNLGLYVPVGCDGDEGTKIISSRPAGGYITKDQLRIALTSDEYKALKNYLTVNAYVDNKVIDPLDTTDTDGDGVYVGSSRAPINVNTAHLFVLKAVLTGITDGTNSITATEADNLATYLISGRDYTTRDELYSRLEAAEAAAVIGSGDAALVMAATNPNTDYMKCNPNQSWRDKHLSASGWQAIDKTDITNYTTEFCLHSGGYYEISSLAQITDNATSNAIAEKQLVSVVKIFDIWLQRHQDEFEAGTKNNVQTYPEFDPASTTNTAATFDGQVMLKTLTDATPNSGTHFRVNYNDEDGDAIDNELDAESGQTFFHRFSAPNANQASVIDAINPGDLYPDGLFPRENDNGSLLTADSSYPNTPLATSKSAGTVEIWFKPDWDATGGTISTYNCPRFLGLSNELSFYDSALEIEFWRDSWNQRVVAKFWTSAIPSAGWYGVDGWTSWAGNYYYYIWSDKFTTWKAGEWHQIAVTYNYNDNGTPGDTSDDTGEQKLFVDGLQVDVGADAHHPVGFANDFSLIQPGGDAWSFVECFSTIPGIRIFDYARTDAQILADYNRGMYYNVSDASFTSSASGDLGSVRLATISWTEHMPAGVTSGDLQVDVYDGSNWLGSYTTRNDPAGESLNCDTQGSNSVQYRVYFVNDNTLPLFDSPVLDEVMITYLCPREILYYSDEF
jgi:hypothetical protein